MADASEKLSTTLPASRFYSSVDLAGKTVLVTGATAGIGEAIACRFAELDVRLVLVGRRAERLESLKARLLPFYKQTVIAEEADRVICYPLDVTDKSGVEKLAETIGFVDVLVNNAGLALGTATADETPYEDTAQMFATNVLACAHLTQVFGSKMRKQQTGHLVFISSVAAKDYYEGGAVYCATKAAIRQYADALRCDVVGTPLRVTTISPGLCETEFSQVRFKGDTGKAGTVYANILPLLPADIADNVVYACTRPSHVQISDLTAYCTNQGHAKYVVSRCGDSLGAK
ncbi:unnamed protein product [Amoebophrya sp. A120]|nr:unnamed protein product [Amoebophrya sp. A120]|eukprot:GSA120T00021597001.1